MQYQLSTGLTIDAAAMTFLRESNGQAYYVRAEGPTSLLWQAKVIEGHGQSRHPHGFSAPIGLPDCFTGAGSWSSVDDCALADAGAAAGAAIHWRYASGVVLKATYVSRIRMGDTLLLMTFDDCSIAGPAGEVLYDPSWGQFDLAVSQ